MGGGGTWLGREGRPCPKTDLVQDLQLGHDLLLLLHCDVQGNHLQEPGEKRGKIRNSGMAPGGQPGGKLNTNE